MAKSRKTVRASKSPVANANSWWPRVWAWLIDVIIIGLIVVILFPRTNTNWFDADIMHSALNGFIFFLYWTLTDSDGRQSIGKKAIGLKLVKKNGKNADVTAAAISAFGKAFLLPIDWLIGVLVRPGKKQRLFNIISDTVVVRTK